MRKAEPKNQQTGHLGMERFIPDLPKIKPAKKRFGTSNMTMTRAEGFEQEVPAGLCSISHRGFSLTNCFLRSWDGMKWFQAEAGRGHLHDQSNSVFFVRLPCGS
eukprot:s3914_g7.t1